MTDFFTKLKNGMNKEDVQETESKQKKIIKKPTKKKVKVKEKEEETDFRKIPLKEEEGWLEQEGELTVDVLQTGKEIIIQSAIAGVEPEDLDITIENDLVIIRGEREKRFAEEKENYFFQECYWGRFSREIILPVEVDSSRAEASMKKGILIIRIPIIEQRKKKTKVSVK